MVQEINAARRRIEERRQCRQDLLDEIEQNTIRVKWQVIEHTPAYNTGGYYDVDVPAKSVVVKDELQTEQSAINWMQHHVPDPGKELFVRKRRLVRHTYTSWM